MSEAAHKTAEKFTWADAAVLFEKALDLAIKRFGKTSAEPSVPTEANPCSAHLPQTLESKRLAKSRFLAFGWVN